MKRCIWIFLAALLCLSGCAAPWPDRPAPAAQPEEQPAAQPEEQPAAQPEEQQEEQQEDPTPETEPPAQARYMALTFDDGPSPTYTPILLDGLRARGVHATFFLIGCKIEGKEELVRRMQAEGHQIGNHSYDHAMLQKTDTRTALADLAECDAVLQRTLGAGTYWVRPPYGLISRAELAGVCAPLVHWSVDTRDWEVLNADRVLDVVLRKADDGDIILLHDCYSTSVEAALRAIDRLSAEGVQFVTVEELFRLKGVEPVCGMLYKRPDATHPAA